MPDIIVAAKGISGGYTPLSMVSATNKVLEPIAEAGNGVMFFTYSGHDASCAGALAVLDILEREQLMDRAAKTGASMLEKLQTALEGVAPVVEVRGRGLMLGIELDGMASTDVVTAALDRDVWIYPGGSGPSVNDGLLFAPPLVITDEQVDRIVSVTAEAITEVAKR